MAQRKETPFIRQIFSEENGQGSLGRVATGAMVTFALGWVTYLVLRNHALPDLGGLSLFVAAIYGTNKAATFISEIKK